MGFDEYASDYDAALERGLAVAGESKDYFARNRIAWLSGNLAALREQPQQIMDYGCGIGSAVPFLIDFFSTASILGVDVSAKSLELAKQVSARATFLSCDGGRSPVGDRIWSSVMACSTTSIRRTGPLPWTTCIARFDREACSRCGKTIPGTPAPATS